MISNTVLSSPVSSVAAAGTQRTLASPLPSKSAPKATLWRELCSFAVDALDLHAWRKVNLMACILLAGFVAIVAQPLVYGGFPGKVVALMTSLSK